ncbi:hypothetical protein L6164_016043 [Bauhinia variegata]|uniref:Uncharacterized protein n=1 Tax=Bauhinia variegata TaxID=167791 RepID=A0ACB9NN32_BAUVA|nr:hypothetical protein L6164_016043 [Bauhinia variegata]
MALTTCSPQRSTACLASTSTHVRWQADSKHDLIRLLPVISKHNRLSASGAAVRVQSSGSKRKINFAILCSVQPGPSLPSNPSPAGSNWKIWIIGSIMTLLFSFSKGKWGPLLKLKEEFKARIDAIEDVVDIVEGVAEKVDKVAEGISDNLPAGKLRDIADFIENVAEKVDKGAEMVEDALEKVEEAGEHMETLLESKIQQEKPVVQVATEAKDQN